MLTTAYCGRTVLLKRFLASAIAGFLMAILYTVFSAVNVDSASDVIVSALWRCFGFTLISVIGAILTELSLPDVENRA
jgi:uncharacterized membrane protein